MKTVAAISFRNDHSVSMDIEAVTRIELSPPVQLDDGSWGCEMLVRSTHGTVAVQLQADSPDKLLVSNGLE
ncbi:MAG: hypothetical protein ACM33T_16330 [Solirubrobacterales bacterium]